MDAGPMGLDPDSRVVAFGDFNADQFLDVLLLSSDQQTLTVYLWSHDAFAFQKSSSFRHPEPISNVVPGDFTHDGKLDLLVMSQSINQQNALDISLYMAVSGGGFASDPLSAPPSTLSQPIPIDTNGDMKIDLLGITPQSSGSNSPIQIWENAWNSSDPNSPIFNIVNPSFNGTQCKLANPHSNAVVDLDGDCLADIFLLCDNGSANKYYQIWVNNKDAGFSLAKTGSLPSGVQSISFADIDRDGTIDMVFVTCSSVSSTGVGTGCSINIAYNKQLPLCASSTVANKKNGQTICRLPEQLCTADPNFNFDFTQSSDNDAYVQIPVASLFPGSSNSPSLLVLDTTHTPALPLPIKLGDANLDGYTDLLFVVDSLDVQHERTPKLVMSVPCAKGVVGCSPSGAGRRGFALVTKGADFLNSVTDARGVAFLDIDEDGTLDIMVQRSGNAGQGKLLFIQNNFYYDAFFLKAIVLNGACDNGWCSIPNSSEKYHPFGVSYSGASYKYTVLDTSGRRSAAQVGQLPQTSYHALQTPYAFFGLGRTNNYIENLFVGCTKHTAKHFINMEGVIPNSKVVILPPPAGSADDAPWKRELYLRPGEWIPWVTVTVVVGTLLLAVIVFVLHLNEKREDELERRRASHHINFDAL